MVLKCETILVAETEISSFICAEGKVIMEPLSVPCSNFPPWRLNYEEISTGKDSEIVRGGCNLVLGLLCFSHLSE